MDTNSIPDEMLQYFKALADANRLKIIGLLSQQPCTVEQLAALLGLSKSTTSHHLAYLAKANLVEARADGHYFFYSLCTETLEKMSKKLLQRDSLPTLADSVDMEAYDRKVLQTFTDSEGRIIAFPSQLKKYQVLLKYVVKAFEPGVRYSEKQVNEILSRFNEDTADLRRGLVEFKFMAREGGGGEYWRLDTSVKD
jgi:predicted transcriptional regulator